MGTAGPIALSAEILKDNKNPGMGRFFVFNSDVICDFPLSEMIDFHKTHGKEGSICATKVADPSKYGVIVFDEGNGKIERTKIGHFTCFCLCAIFTRIGSSD